MNPPTPPPLYTEKHIRNQLGVFLSPDIRELRFPDLDTQVPSKRRVCCSTMTYPRGEFHNATEQQVHLPLHV